MPAKNSKKTDFEASLKALNTIVENMEQGELSLEDSLKQFEEGIKLTRQCQQSLQEAEQKVEILTAQGEEMALAAFADDDEEDFEDEV